jgi:hypothetical protein
VADQQAGGWKWIAGVFALVVTYQVGYNSGTKNATATQPPAVQSSYVPSLANVTGVDALTVSPSDTSVEAVSADLNALTGSDETSNTTTDVDTAPGSALATAPAGEPWTRYRSDPIVTAANDDEDTDTADLDQGVDEVALAPSPAATPVAPSTALSSYVPSKPSSYGCAENGSCYGDISAATGRAKTVSVSGYFRKDGTYVRGHYRSRPH